MSDYLHGAYGYSNVLDSGESETGVGAIVYIGTAPVHLVENGAKSVNKPILVRNIAEARKYFGYSDNWADYTLCEAMHVHFENKAVGPLVLINVLDPAVHKSGTQGTASLTPANGVITIANAESIVLDSVVIATTASTPVTKVKGTDYSIAYDYNTKSIVATELTAGALGTAALSITYDTVTPASVTSSVVIGSSDGAGSNTGLYAVRNVYALTGYIPAFIAAPGFSSVPAIHDVMAEISQKINDHWDAYMFVDIPITYNSSAVTLANVATWKSTNHYNKENETVFFPLAKGIDGKTYHLSVLAAANFQELLLEQDGIPYKTASNTACEIIENLYLGATEVNRVYDEEIINEALNKNGIASAVYTGGRWAIWGAHSADYSFASGMPISVAETNRMMLYYVCNDFQARRSIDIDKPISLNDLNTIVSEEQARIDALVNIGALIYGAVALNAENLNASDIIKGDFSITFNVTTTPLMKSLTAIVNWTERGYQTFYTAE